MCNEHPALQLEKSPRAPTEAEVERVRVHVIESVYKVDFQKSIVAQVRQLIIYISNTKG